MKKLTSILILMAFVFTGCVTTTGDVTAEDNTQGETAEATTESTENAENITFGSNITTDGTAEVEGNVVTITDGGSYTLTGSSDDSELIVNAPEEDVTLTLDNLNLTSAKTSAITGIDAASINIILSGDSTLSDTESNTEDYQAPLYIDEIETHISGDGTLNLNGNYQEGLESNNDLYIDSGTLNIKAVDDGINVGDLLSINGGVINVDSNGDGLDSNGDLEITGGEMYVSGGNNGNGPVDYGDEGNTFSLTGGTIIAVGGSMGVAPTESGGQTFLTTTASGTKVSSGDYTYDSPKEFSYVFISYDGLTEDTEVQVDGNSTETTQEVSSAMGGRGGGGPAGMGEAPTDMGEKPTF